MIGIIANGKPNCAKELLDVLADELGQRLGDCEIVLAKPGAGNPMPPEMADAMAVRAHLVISGLGD